MRTSILTAIVVLAICALVVADERDDRIRELEAQNADLRSRLDDLTAETQLQAREAEEELERTRSELRDITQRSVDHEDLLRSEINRLSDRCRTLEAREEDRQRREEDLNVKEHALWTALVAYRSLLVLSLESDDRTVRGTGMKVVVDERVSEAVPRLVKLLGTGDPEERLQVAHALHRLGRVDEALPALRGWVVDDGMPGELRDRALYLLLGNSDRDQLHRLSDVAATRGEKGVCYLAGRLARHDDPAGIPLLLERAKDGVSPQVEKTLEELFGGKPPAGMAWGDLWNACRSKTAREVRASAGAIRALRTEKTGAAFRDTPIAGVLKFLAYKTRESWECLPGAEGAIISYRCEDKIVEEAAREALATVGLVHRVVRGVVLVGTAKELEDATKSAE